MDSKKLEILVTAVDLGSFSKAAEVTGYTQSGLTHMMDSLEQEIGFPLLIRTHTGISLTTQGEKLMPAIRSFLQAGAHLENQILNERNEQGETIRIAAYASIALHWMPEILYRFRRECPKIQVDLRMVDDALEPFELLERGKTDVIFASRQKGFSCDWIALYNEPLYAILPGTYPIDNRTEFPLTEFAGQEFLMPYGKFDIDVSAAMQKAGVTLSSTQTRVDDETVIRMVGRGLGVSLMGELMIRGSRDNVLCIPVFPQTCRELGLGVNSYEKASGTIRKLIDCVLAYLGESGIAFTRTL